jgi:hypothetical protein
VATSCGPMISQIFFAVKMGKTNIKLFDLKCCSFMTKTDHNVCFQEKRQFFLLKNSQNTDPQESEETVCAECYIRNWIRVKFINKTFHNFSVPLRPDFSSNVKFFKKYL